MDSHGTQTRGIGSGHTLSWGTAIRTHDPIHLHYFHLCQTRPFTADQKKTEQGAQRWMVASCVLSMTGPAEGADEPSGETLTQRPVLFKHSLQ